MKQLMDQKIYNRDYQIKRPKTAVEISGERHSWMATIQTLVTTI
jgi:hypothetical protein